MKRKGEKMKKDDLNQTGFIRLKEILKIIPVSRDTFWTNVSKGVYPKPYKLSPGVTAWKVEDIRQLIEKTIPSEDYQKSLQGNNFSQKHDEEKSC